MDPTTAPGAPAMPLWVKVFIGVGVAILLVAVGVLALGGGEHGPGRHFGADDTASDSPSQTTPTGHMGTHPPQPDEVSPRRPSSA